MNEKTNGSIKGVLIASAVVIGAMVASALWAWLQIAPDAKIPTHWGLSGKANRFGSRDYLFYLPAVMAAVVALAAAIPRFEPRRGNLLKSSKAYKATWYGMLGFMALVHGAMVLAALGREVRMMMIMALGMGALFVVIGNFMGKLRSNYLVGVKTPWTLSSELSWNKTNRLAGRIFVVWGAVVAVSGLVDPTGRAMMWIVIGGVGVLIGVVLVYSYVVWKADPGKK